MVFCSGLCTRLDVSGLVDLTKKDGTQFSVIGYSFRGKVTTLGSMLVDSAYKQSKLFGFFAR